MDERMKLRMSIVLMTLALVMLVASTLPSVFAQVSFCCEQTTYGAWCVNDVQESCNPNFKIAPTACDSTSYCKRGTCFDSQEGLCSENTPQQVCENNEGTWVNDRSTNVPQCQLGCCLLADQASLSTLTRCKSLAGYYGLDIDFRSDITDELTCIATANTLDKGACVFEDPESHSPTCKFTTRGECGDSGDFHTDVLCSAEELGTVCAKTRETMIIDGKDEIYYRDSCGNPANVYDASRFDDDYYWTYVIANNEICGAGESNANSKDCGNCDYFLGSIAKEATLLGTKPTYGDYICADLSCDNGKQHGSSWCVTDPDSGESKDRVGSRHFKQICVNGEVLVEPCADFRNEVCVQAGSGFTEAACIVNRWQTCSTQQEQDDCENQDARDCRWIEGYYMASDGTNIGLQVSSNPDETDEDKKTPKGLCVPNFSPGFTFWGDQGSAVTAEKAFGASTQAFGATTPSASTTGRAIGNEDEESSEDEDRVADLVEEDEPAFGATTTGFGSNTPAFGSGAVTTPKASVSASDTCSSADITISLDFERKIKRDEGGKDVKDWNCNGEILTKNKDFCDYFEYGGDDRDEPIELSDPQAFADEMNEICMAIGDCGSNVNWLGQKPEKEEGYAVYHRGERVAGSGGAEILEKANEGTTGNVIKEFLGNIYGGEKDDDE